jgi:hypothetical protein
MVRTCERVCMPLYHMTGRLPVYPSSGPFVKVAASFAGSPSTPLVLPASPEP